MTLRLGDPVGDLVLRRPDGEPLPLAAFAGRPLVLLFVRHLA